MKYFDLNRMAVLAVGVMLCGLLVSCGQASTPVAATASPLPVSVVTSVPTLAAPLLTPLAIPATPAPRPTATPVPVLSTPTRDAAAAHLVTENIEFTVPVSEDDMDPIIPSIQNLNGVTAVQAGGNGLQVTYDPAKVSHKQIVDVIGGYGFHVKE